VEEDKEHFPYIIFHFSFVIVGINLLVIWQWQMRNGK